MNNIPDISVDNMDSIDSINDIDSEWVDTTPIENKDIKTFERMEKVKEEVNIRTFSTSILDRFLKEQCTETGNIDIGTLIKELKIEEENIKDEEFYKELDLNEAIARDEHDLDVLYQDYLDRQHKLQDDLIDWLENCEVQATIHREEEKLDKVYEEYYKYLEEESQKIFDEYYNRKVIKQATLINDNIDSFDEGNEEVQKIYDLYKGFR